MKCEYKGNDSLFKTVNGMRAHMMKHNGLKIFGCEWPSCEARFKSKIYLKRHLETHTGERISASTEGSAPNRQLFIDSRQK